MVPNCVPGCVFHDCFMLTGLMKLLKLLTLSWGFEATAFSSFYLVSIFKCKSSLILDRRERDPALVCQTSLLASKASLFTQLARLQELRAPLQVTLPT